MSQPEALRIADMLTDYARYAHETERDAELRRQHEEIERLTDDLKFVERWAVHHGTKPSITPQEVLSTIQHYPGIKSITESYADGVIPDTFNPWAEIERLRALNAEMLEALRRAEKTVRLYPAWAGHADDFAQLIAKAEASNG